MSVWSDNKKRLFPSLFTPLHSALLNACVWGWGGMDSNKKSKNKELDSPESLTKLIYPFFKPESYLGILKKLGGSI